MIVTYNKAAVGDVLMVTLQQETTPVSVEKKGKIARIFSQETGETLAWNIFEASELFSLSGAGQIFLTQEQVEAVNAALVAAGFSEQLAYDSSPKFVTAEIVEMIDHPDSDHLHICQVAIGQSAPVQIVCGAPNAALGLKTIAALPGAMMPDGSLIFTGELRGEASHGMLCSARELHLPNAPQERGIIELAADTPVGQAFDVAKHWRG